MPTVTFRIDTIPRGAGRPKVAVRGGHGVAYKDAKSREHEATIASLVAQHKPVSILEGGVSLDVCCVLPRPADMCKLAARTGKPLKDPARYPHIGRPDADDIGKSVLDGMSKCGFWRDDAQVWDLRVTKMVAALDEQPHYLVRVMWATLAEDAELNWTMELADAFGTDNRGGK